MDRQLGQGIGNAISPGAQLGMQVGGAVMNARDAYQDAANAYNALSAGEIIEGIGHAVNLADNASLAKSAGAFMKPKVVATPTVGAASRTSGETIYTKSGRAAHASYDPGPTYDKKFVLPSGKKPDAVDIDAKIVRELKPNHQAAIRRGERQIESYRKELEQLFGGKWTAVVDTY